MSVMGKLITCLMGKIMVFNPERNKNILGSTAKIGMDGPYRKPRGYDWETFTRDNYIYETYQKTGAKPKIAILMLHGGGYIGPLGNIYRKYAKLLVDGTGAKVYMLDYRLAPNFLFPTALEDAYDFWELVEKEFTAKNIIVIGDSAGGNLSLALMQKLRDEGRPMPRAGVLISPWCDMLAAGDSYTYNYPHDVMFGYRGKQFDESLRAGMLACDIFYYFKDVKDRHDPYVSPVYGEYHGFPECFFTAATNEMLLSDSETIVGKINAAGGKAELYCKHKMFHVYPICGNLCKESKEANKAIVDFINRKIAE